MSSQEHINPKGSQEQSESHEDVVVNYVEETDQENNVQVPVLEEIQEECQRENFQNTSPQISNFDVHTSQLDHSYDEVILESQDENTLIPSYSEYRDFYQNVTGDVKQQSKEKVEQPHRDNLGELYHAFQSSMLPDIEYGEDSATKCSLLTSLQMHNIIGPVNDKNVSPSSQTQLNQQGKNPQSQQRFSGRLIPPERMYQMLALLYNQEKKVQSMARGSEKLEAARLVKLQKKELLDLCDKCSDNILGQNNGSMQTQSALQTLLAKCRKEVGKRSPDELSINKVDAALFQSVVNCTVSNLGINLLAKEGNYGSTFKSQEDVGVQITSMPVFSARQSSSNQIIQTPVSSDMAPKFSIDSVPHFEDTSKLISTQLKDRPETEDTWNELVKGGPKKLKRMLKNAAATQSQDEEYFMTVQAFVNDTFGEKTHTLSYGQSLAHAMKTQTLELIQQYDKGGFQQWTKILVRFYGGQALIDNLEFFEYLLKICATSTGTRTFKISLVRTLVNHPTALCVMRCLAYSSNPQLLQVYRQLGSETEAMHSGICQQKVIDGDVLVKSQVLRISTDSVNCPMCGHSEPKKQNKAIIDHIYSHPPCELLKFQISIAPVRMQTIQLLKDAGWCSYKQPANSSKTRHAHEEEQFMRATIEYCNSDPTDASHPGFAFLSVSKDTLKQILGSPQFIGSLKKTVFNANKESTIEATVKQTPRLAYLIVNTDKFWGLEYFECELAFLSSISACSQRRSQLSYGNEKDTLLTRERILNFVEYWNDFYPKAEQHNKHSALLKKVKQMMWVLASKLKFQPLAEKYTPVMPYQGFSEKNVSPSSISGGSIIDTNQQLQNPVSVQDNISVDAMVQLSDSVCQIVKKFQLSTFLSILTHKEDQDLKCGYDVASIKQIEDRYFLLYVSSHQVKPNASATEIMNSVQEHRFTLPGSLLTVVDGYFKLFYNYSLCNEKYNGILSALPACTDAFLFSQVANKPLSVVAGALQAVSELLEACSSKQYVSFSFDPDNIIIIQCQKEDRPYSLRTMNAPYVIDYAHQCIARFIDCSRIVSIVSADVDDICDYGSPSRNPLATYSDHRVLSTTMKKRSIVLRADLIAVKCCMALVLPQITSTGTISATSIYAHLQLPMSNRKKAFNQWINPLLKLDSGVDYDLAKRGTKSQQVDTETKYQFACWFTAIDSLQKNRAQEIQNLQQPNTTTMQSNSQQPQQVPAFSSNGSDLEIVQVVPPDNSSNKRLSKLKRKEEEKLKRLYGNV